MSTDELRAKCAEVFGITRPEALRVLETMPRERVLGMLYIVGVEVRE